MRVRELPPENWPVNRLRNNGAAALSTVEVLAAVLQTPDALGQAAQLLARFDTLQGLARATESELAEIQGIGPGRAAQIKAAVELGRRTFAGSIQDRPQVRSPADVFALVGSEMQALDREQLWVLNMSTKNHVLSITKLYAGTVTTMNIRAAEVFQAAVRIGAPSIIMVHNHPSGDPSPSPEDGNSAKECKAAGKILGIDLFDALVVAGGRFVSLRERGLM